MANKAGFGSKGSALPQINDDSPAEDSVLIGSSRPPAHRDTRKFLSAGSWLFGGGVLCLLLMFSVFGGAGHQGPHTNMGWLLLILALGLLPVGFLTLVLGIAKLIGDKSR